MYDVGSIESRRVNKEFQSSAMESSSFFSGFIARIVETRFMLDGSLVEKAVVEVTFSCVDFSSVAAPPPSLTEDWFSTL